MKNTRKLGIAVLLGAVVSISSGCSPSIELDPESEHMVHCEDQGEPIPVQELASDQFDACDLAGQSVEFPGGSVHEVRNAAVNYSSREGGGSDADPMTYVLLNLGIDGVFAARYTNSTLEVWGPPEAIRLAVDDREVWLN